MTTPPDLAACQSLIDEGGELQWRQVHPKFVDGDVIAREAFVGTPEATDEVSTTRASVVSGEEAYRHHSDHRGLQTAGSWGIAVHEAQDAQCRVVDDSNCEGVDTPGHSFLDMRDLSKSERRKARNEWAAIATARGRSFP